MEVKTPAQSSVTSTASTPTLRPQATVQRPGTHTPRPPSPPPLHWLSLVEMILPAVVLYSVTCCRPRHFCPGSAVEQRPSSFSLHCLLATVMAFLKPYFAALYSTWLPDECKRVSTQLLVHLTVDLRLLVGELPDFYDGQNVVNTSANVPRHILLNLFDNGVCLFQSLSVCWVQEWRDVI